MFALCRCTAHKHPITALICRADGQQYYIAISVSIRLSARMGALKTQVLENACTENASTMQTFSQIKKFGTSPFSVVHFQVGWESGLQIVFF